MLESPDTQDRPGPILGDEQLYLADSLLDKKVTRMRGKGGCWRNVIFYLVRFQGYGPADDQWRPAHHVGQALKDAYEASHHADLPTQPRSSRRKLRRR